MLAALATPTRLKLDFVSVLPSFLAFSRVTLAAVVSSFRSLILSFIHSFIHSFVRSFADRARVHFKFKSSIPNRESSKCRALRMRLATSESLHSMVSSAVFAIRFFFRTRLEIVFLANFCYVLLAWAPARWRTLQKFITLAFSFAFAFAFPCCLRETRKNAISLSSERTSEWRRKKSITEQCEPTPRSYRRR